MRPGLDWTSLGSTLLGARLGEPVRELLYLSPMSAHAAGKAVRGGVPLIFPQFLDLGPLPRHGFARTATWRTLERTDTSVRAELTERDVESTWPHRFRVTFTASIRAASLDISMDVANTGDEPFTFTSALHTYLRVSDIAAVRIGGLSGARFDDMVVGASGVETRGSIHIDRKVDVRYFDVRGPVIVDDGRERLELRQRGFADVVVWNPGPEDAAALPDLPDDGDRSFVCVEAACLAPAEVAAGQTWRGEHVVRVLR